jgi:hypothetical protein
VIVGEVERREVEVSRAPSATQMMGRSGELIYKKLLFCSTLHSMYSKINCVIHDSCCKSNALIPPDKAQPVGITAAPVNLLICSYQHRGDCVRNIPLIRSMSSHMLLIHAEVGEELFMLETTKSIGIHSMHLHEMTFNIRLKSRDSHTAQDAYNTNCHAILYFEADNVENISR